MGFYLSKSNHSKKENQKKQKDAKLLPIKEENSYAKASKPNHVNPKNARLLSKLTKKEMLNQPLKLAKKEDQHLEISPKELEMLRFLTNVLNKNFLNIV